MSEEHITFMSGDLRLEGIIATPVGKGRFPVVILCHPHPLYGGDMYDHVISTVAQALLNRGIATLRFNFRGVGESQGSYGRGQGEKKDTVAAIDYVLARPDVSPDRIGLAGYSFGGGVAFNVALNENRIMALALISPVIPDSGWKRLGEYQKPKLLTLGDRDEYFPLAAYGPKISDAMKESEYAIFPGADHFWTGSVVTMAERVSQFFAISVI